MSKEEAERLLLALRNKERQTKQKIDQNKQAVPASRQGNDW
jgi:hypothetical protein